MPTALERWLAVCLVASAGLAGCNQCPICQVPASASGSVTRPSLPPLQEVPLNARAETTPVTRPSPPTTAALAQVPLPPPAVAGRLPARPVTTWAPAFASAPPAGPRLYPDSDYPRSPQRPGGTPPPALRQPALPGVTKVSAARTPNAVPPGGIVLASFALPPPADALPPARVLSPASLRSLTESAKPLRAEPAAARREVIDLKPDSCTGHAPDFSWVRGRLEYARAAKTWRLRYASVDEEDSYGGSVTLLGEPYLSDLKDGQYVRIQGHLVNPRANHIAPSYRVECVTFLGPEAGPACTLAR